MSFVDIDPKLLRLQTMLGTERTTLYISDMMISYEVRANGYGWCGLLINALSNTNAEDRCRGSWRLEDVGAHISLWKAPRVGPSSADAAMACQRLLTQAVSRWTADCWAVPIVVDPTADPSRYWRLVLPLLVDDINNKHVLQLLWQMHHTLEATTTTMARNAFGRAGFHMDLRSFGSCVVVAGLDYQRWRGRNPLYRPPMPTRPAPSPAGVHCTVVPPVNRALRTAPTKLLQRNNAFVAVSSGVIVRVRSDLDQPEWWVWARARALAQATRLHQRGSVWLLGQTTVPDFRTIDGEFVDQARNVRIINLPIRIELLSQAVARVLNSMDLTGRNFPAQLARDTATSLAYMIFEAVSLYVNYLPTPEALITTLAVSATSRAGRTLRISMLRILISALQYEGTWV